MVLATSTQHLGDMHVHAPDSWRRDDVRTFLRLFNVLVHEALVAVLAAAIRTELTEHMLTDELGLAQVVAYIRAEARAFHQSIPINVADRVLLGGLGAQHCMQEQRNKCYHGGRALFVPVPSVHREAR